MEDDDAAKRKITIPQKGLLRTMVREDCRCLSSVAIARFGLTTEPPMAPDGGAQAFHDQAESRLSLKTVGPVARSGRALTPILSGPSRQQAFALLE